MPPTRGPYRKDPPPTLSTEQLAELDALFQNYRKQLTCPACKVTTTFHRHGSTSRDPTQPQFMCTSCHRYMKAYQMYHLLKLTAAPVDYPSQSDTMDFETPTHENDANVDLTITPVTTPTDDSHSAIEQLQKMVAMLTSELSKAHLAIKNLQTQLQTLSTQPTKDPNCIPATDFPSIKESLNISSTQFPDAPWHNQAKVDALKQSMLRQRELRRVQREAAAARFFQPPSPNQGFKYLYIPTKARIPVGTLRTTFRRLGVNNARLLDIHYPARHTAAILIHNDYETEFTELLSKHRISPKMDFDPNSGKTLEDPNLAALSDAERDNAARQHQITRLERAVHHIRAPVKFAVARFFYDKQWISKKFYDTIVAARNPQLSNIFDQSPAAGDSNTNDPTADDINMLTADDFEQFGDRDSQPSHH